MTKQRIGLSCGSEESQRAKNRIFYGCFAQKRKFLSRIRDFYNVSDLIKVITGVRRRGKSCLMETIAGELR